MQSVRVSFASTKKFSISRQKRLSMPSMLVCVSRAQSFFWISRPRNDNNLPRNSSGSLELFIVWKTTVFEQPSSASSSHTQPARNTWNERRSTFKRKCTKRLGHKRYQVSADLDDVEFYWESDQLDVDAVFRPGIDTPFSPTAFDDLEMGGSAENPILLDEREDKENSPPTKTTSVSERPTQPPAMLRTCPFGTGIENVPDYIYRNLFQ